ncbi:MAG: GAF domain-containing protein [Phormidesmis sp.]
MSEPLSIFSEAVPADPRDCSDPISEQPSSSTGAVPADYPDNEDERVQKLLRYRVLDTGAEIIYDDLTALAAYICGTQTAVISFIDVGRQWFKAKVGLAAAEHSRELSFCAHAILRSDIMIVPDAREDERFACNPLVTGEPYIRFYAGAPLISPDGYAVGTLCVLDQAPKQLTERQIGLLEAITRQIVSQLEMRLLLQKIQQEKAEKETMSAELQQANVILEKRVQARTEAIRYKNRHLERTLEELKRAQA